MADSSLSELFARLKNPNAHQSPSTETPPPQSHYHQPSVSSPIFSPSPNGPRPHHSSAIMSPVNTPGADAGTTDRTTNLLNLLKFNHPQQASPAPVRQASVTSDGRPPSLAAFGALPENQGPQARPVSASDLVANFMKKPQSSMAMHSPAVASPASGRAEPHHTPSTENPQDLLLKLLNNPKSLTASEAGSVRHLDLNKSPVGPAKSPSASFTDLEEQLSEARPTSNVPFNYVDPFEQLERSSPLNLPHRPSQPTRIDVLKHQRDISSGLGGEGSGPSPKARKIATGPEEAEISHESVSQAVDELGQQVEKELEEVLGEAVVKVEKSSSPEAAGIKQAVLEKDAEAATKAAAADIKRELQDEETREVLEAALDKPTVAALKQVAAEVADDDIADSWESADAEDSPAQGEEAVKVFNFPMRPFTSIEVVRLQEKPPVFRSSTVMEIAKLKKEFDQMDRQLVCASKNFIVYATLKPLGFRVIRQESGQYRQVFSGWKERIFNISMCTPATGSAATESEAVLGTSVNGSVLWTSIQSAQTEGLEDEDLDDAGFIFPPAPVNDDNTSGGQLKTRAKTSTRHPEFFAVGRGKSIHLVYPKLARQERYTNTKTHMCDSEKYLQERTLKITTGKAGKDFAFSADDTVIVSLDKAGRMRFWDIKGLWDAASDTPTGPVEPVDIRKPIWTLQTTSPSEKSWPTSVFFLDKERPLSKGIATRYMVVGQKQNHTLQLWDLGLGKAVQELCLPHDNESDAICTVAYHAKSGVMVVGHPTRNSIYFIHISAPKYNLPAMSQSRYLQLLSEPKANLPKVDSTAIMSGIREYSLGNKGTLRTLHLLEEHSGSSEFGSGDSPVFELYVVHSKGVSLVNIHREDLGWTKDFRVANPVDAHATGAVQVSPLRAPQPVTEGSGSTNGESRAAPSVQSTARETVKKESSSTSRAVSQTPEAAIRASTLAKVESKQEAERAAIINGADKSEKKKKKRATDAASQISSTPSRAISSQPLAPVSPLPSYAQAAQRPTSPRPSTVAPSKSSEPDAPDWALQLLAQQSSARSGLDDASYKRLSGNISTDVGKTIDDSLDSLYKRIADDKRVMDASSYAKQEAILRLVSSTLSDNLDQAFSRHIKETVSSSILPSLTNVVSTTLRQNISKTLQQTTTEVITREFNTSLASHVNKAMQEPDTLRIISDLVANKVARSFDAQLSTSMEKLAPKLSNIALNAAQQVSVQVDHRIAEQFRQSEMQRQADTIKVDQLTKLVHSLADSMKTMGVAQAEGQAEIIRLQRQLLESQGSRSEPEPEVHPKDEELEGIREHIDNARYEDGTIMWLQSQRQAELFDLLFVHCNPDFIKHLSPLVALSVAAAATSSLETHLAERLVWLDTVLSTIDPKDEEIFEVTPQIMDVLASRLQLIYMAISEKQGSHAAPLKRVSVLHRKAMELKNIAQQYFHAHPSQGK